MSSFEKFFEELTGNRPYGWQSVLATADGCANHLIRIPTGFGKTLGVLGAWSWHRVGRNDDRWPRRLVWCLPMRVLVEQTEQETRQALKKVGLLWDGSSDHTGKVGVHLLMGGVEVGDWHLYPEHCAVLIGTQDMLISRAMNRGYAAPRARWPMEFGLLNQDCLWVMDEVQLMDVGLATSAQLQAFREDDADNGRALRPCRTWWMSATLQHGWLQKSPDTQEMAASLSQTAIPATKRAGHLWDDVRKPCRLEPVKEVKTLAKLITAQHIETGRGANGPTLVVVNTVDRAVQVFEALQENKDLKGSDLRLVHSRFRPHERASWREEFLNRDACSPNTDRIVVATQVVEAGVDLSAALLVTELAPWASLVQRFGRSARWGGVARVIVADFADDKKCAPYTKEELQAAREALGYLTDVAPLHLEAFEEAHPDLLPRLYPYAPTHLLLRHELDELFDTTPDLSGADIDISRFIRSGGERDLHVFWMDLPEKTEPSLDIKPARDALCAVPFLKAREWLCGDNKASRLKKGMRAWVWDWQDGEWRTAERRDLYPGQTVLVDARCGGYDPTRGWFPDSGPVAPVCTSVAAAPDERADAAQDDETLSVAERYKTIATHGRETGQVAHTIANAVVAAHADLFDLAGRWHDTGKVHLCFAGSIVSAERPPRADLAKAPDAAWLRGKKLYPMPDGTRRPGFRHELASVLALFGVLQRHNPDHPALLGPWRELLDKAGLSSPLPQAGGAQRGERGPTSLENEILALDADRFNLLAYLICAHHGKLRLAWHASKGDQNAQDSALRIRGVREDDILPPLTLAAANGALHELPATALDLAPAASGISPRTGAAWTDRVLGMLAQFGPFTLAWLEALLRAADLRASRNRIADPLLEADNETHELERSHSTLAQPAGGRETAPPVGEYSPQRGGEHGLRAGAGGPGDAGSGTRPPAHATRHIKTRLGDLTYAELAPHLALSVQALEQDIESGAFDRAAPDDDLIQQLHHRICGELTPQLTGWRRGEVQVGSHTPPEFYHVPVLMREYARDLRARLEGTTDLERLIEMLAFAEGRLLFIHPFADFNGRVTRVFLRLLLRRLDLPLVRLAPASESSPAYLAALRAADRADFKPLMAIWRERFEKGAEA